MLDEADADVDILCVLTYNVNGTAPETLNIKNFAQICLSLKL